MIDTNYLYLVPLILGALYLFFQLLLGQNMKKERPFDNDYSNLFYNLSGVAPFKWFIEEDPRHEKAITLNQLIKNAEMEEKMNYESATTMQVSFLGLGLIVFGMINLMLISIISVLAFLFNLDASTIVQDVGTMGMVRVFIAMACLLPALGLKFYLKNKAKKSEIDFLKDLPLLQLFIILMLRSNRTISEVLYVLSTTKSTYQKTFQYAYRVYLREPSDGFDFLEDTFGGTKLIETIYTLRDFGEYAKEESIASLENNQEEIVEYTSHAKRKAAAGQNLLASISMTFPFIAVIALAAGPAVYWGLGLLSSSGM